MSAVGIRGPRRGGGVLWTSNSGRRALAGCASGLLIALVLWASPAARGQQLNGLESASSPSAARAGQTESFFSLLWQRAGPIEVVISGMSVYLIALVVWMAFQYRRSVAVPETLVREANDLLAQ